MTHPVIEAMARAIARDRKDYEHERTGRLRPEFTSNAQAALRAALEVADTGNDTLALVNLHRAAYGDDTAPTEG